MGVKKTSEIDDIKKEIILDKYITAKSKVQFINELKNGLGAEIKQSGGKVKAIEEALKLI